MSWETPNTSYDSWGTGGAAATSGFDDFGAAPAGGFDDFSAGATDFGNGDARGGDFGATGFDNGDARGDGNGGCFNCGEEGYVHAIAALISTDTS